MHGNDVNFSSTEAIISAQNGVFFLLEQIDSKRFSFFSEFNVVHVVGFLLKIVFFFDYPIAVPAAGRSDSPIVRWVFIGLFGKAYLRGMRHLTKYIVFLFACVMVIREWLDVYSANAMNSNEAISYVVPDAVIYSSIALVIVGLSIFLKRNIWSYLFLFALIASFFPTVSFTNFHLVIFIGSLEFDLIAIGLLVAHILLNPYLIGRLKLTREEKEDSDNEKVQFFVQQLAKKSNEELLRMSDSDLLPEAIEAKKRILAERGL